MSFAIAKTDLKHKESSIHLENNQVANDRTLTNTDILQEQDSYPCFHLNNPRL